MARQLDFFSQPEPSLEEVQRQALLCQRCRLAAGRRHVVFGEGPVPADLMWIGEGPGQTEDELGRPFVGRAGELLTRIIEAAGFRREEVYITNIVMCRPPGNRTPLPDEMEACRPFLEEKLRLVAPKIAVLLGSTAAKAFLGPDTRITQVRGRWHHVGGIAMMPTYHPAALLRDPRKKREVWEDVQKVRDLYRELMG